MRHCLGKILLTRQAQILKQSSCHPLSLQKCTALARSTLAEAALSMQNDHMTNRLWTAPIAAFLLCLSIIPLASKASPALLEGEWIRPCENGVIRSETFSRNTVIFGERFHYDRACAQGAFELLMGGLYGVRAHEMDFRSTDALAKPLDERIAMTWNQQAVCGFRDWKVGEAKLVTAMACDFFSLGSPFQVPPRGLLRYGIWKIEGNRLYLGLMTAEFDASTPQKRPREWDSRAYLRVFAARHFSIR